jgi:hypothetical protein
MSKVKIDLLNNFVKTASVKEVALAEMWDVKVLNVECCPLIVEDLRLKHNLVPSIVFIKDVVAVPSQGLLGVDQLEGLQSRVILSVYVTNAATNHFGERLFLLQKLRILDVGSSS